MRVLILSCNTGQGHNAVASAIAEKLTDNAIACDCEDAIGFISDNLSQLMEWGHSYMYRHIPKLFEVGYGFAERHADMMDPEKKIYKIFSKGAKRLYEFWEAGKYDVVLCPHVFSALLASETKRRYGLPAMIYFVATDYTCHPGTAIGNMNGWFIPDPALAGEYVAQGVPEDKIIPVGIPVRKAFWNRENKADAKKKLGIPENYTHLLMSCGSMGCGPMEELTEILAAQLGKNQMLTVVCGTNEKLYKNLTQITEGHENIRILGYCNDMDTLMSGADLYLTKPGGISVTEASAKELPMVFVDAVSGCEEYNLQFFVNAGAAVTAKTPEELAKLCLQLLADNQMLENMKQAGGLRLNGAQNILEYLQVVTAEGNGR